MTDARIPTYRRQKAKPYDRAFVEHNGRRLYLAHWGTPESQVRYRRTIARWLESGWQGETDQQAVSVAGIAAAFWLDAENRLRRADGSPIEGSLEGYRWAPAVLNHLYGTCRASEFVPAELRIVQQQMI